MGWWVAALLAAPLVFVTLGICALRVLPPPTSAFMLAERIDAWQAGRSGTTLAWHWVPAQEISAHAALAVIAAEDQKFPRHRGFDIDALEQALAERRRGGKVRGASTISQQVAKNLFLWSGRSWLRKGLEAALTVLVEAVLPKARILELYLNIAEFGPGVYGVEAAAESYFGHSASALSGPEAALLAAVLPAPKRWLVSSPSTQVQARQRWILSQMQRLGGRSYLATLAWPQA